MNESPTNNPGFLEWLAKAFAGRALTAVIILGTAGAGFWFWRNPEHLALTWLSIRYTLAWGAFVAVLPWATFFLTLWIKGKESNAASSLLLIAYFTADAALALWLLGGFSGHHTLTWVVVGFGLLLAAAYNYVVCESISRYAEDR